MRRDAVRERRATPRLEEFPGIEQMLAAVDRAYETPKDARPYSRKDIVGERPLDYVERYAGRAQRRAYYFTGATANADELHALACGSAPGIPIPGCIASMAAPVAGAASSIAAGFNGDVRWPAGTSRQAFNRHVADVHAAGPTFYYMRGGGGE